MSISVFALLPDGFDIRQTLTRDLQNVRVPNEVSSLRGSTAELSDGLYARLLQSLERERLDPVRDVATLWQYGFAFHCVLHSDWDEKGPTLDIRSILPLLLSVVEQVQDPKFVPVFSKFTFDIRQALNNPQVCCSKLSSLVRMVIADVNGEPSERVEKYRTQVLAVSIGLWVAKNLGRRNGANFSPWSRSSNTGTAKFKASFRSEIADF